MKKVVEKPRYTNNSNTRIEYDAVYYDNEGNRKQGSRVLVNKGSDEFDRIEQEFGVEEIKNNKSIAINEIETKKERVLSFREDKEKKELQGELFQFKSYLFSTKLVHETTNKKLRRMIRKAQTMEETRFIANALLMESILGTEVDLDKLADQLTNVDQND